MQPVDIVRQLEVLGGELARRVVGERQTDAVPSVDENIGVVVRGLGRVGDLVDERDRRREVGKVAVADDLLVLSPPSACLEVAVDGLVGQ